MRRKFERVFPAFLSLWLSVWVFACREPSVAATTPRPLYGMCVETPCRVRLEAVSVQARPDDRRPPGVLADAFAFYRLDPQTAVYRFSENVRVRPAHLEAVLQISRQKTQRVSMKPHAEILLTHLDFPGIPEPRESTVFAPVRSPAGGSFVCGQDAGAGFPVYVPWVQAQGKNWTPLRILMPSGQVFVFSHLPAAGRTFWLALVQCLGPAALARPRPGEITDAQLGGISLWQWLPPAHEAFAELDGRLRQPSQDVTVGVVRNRDVRVFVVRDPVDFLEIMLRERILAPDAVWAAWTRLLQAGMPAAHFARLRPHLLPETTRRSGTYAY